MMPGLNGHEVCRRIRSDDRTAFLPVVMITASGPEQRLTALEAGADDFVTKPFDKSELLARVASLGRLKRYHDTIETQAAELATGGTPSSSGGSPSASPSSSAPAGCATSSRSQLAEVVVADDALLDSHRREIVVVFFDFHGFTSFAETSEPEEVMAVLREYHEAVGTHVPRTEARWSGSPATASWSSSTTRSPATTPRRARCDSSLEVDRDVRRLAEAWRRPGHALTHRTGISMGFATLGRIGFPGRFDYAAVGSVTNLASRLCNDAGDWEIRVSDRVLAALDDRAEVDLVGDLQLRGFSRTVRVHTVRSFDGDEVTT